MDVPPTRGSAVRELGVALPPERMALVRGGRPLKRWRYVGVFGPDLMLCAAEVFVGPLATRYWGVVGLDGRLSARRALLGSGGVCLDDSRVRVASRGDGSAGGHCRSPVSIHLDLDEAAGPPGVESVSPGARGGYLWTRKCVGVPARGSVTVNGVPHPVEAEAAIDESAGYHPRHTRWCWSAGVGLATGGQRVGWNLVEGINDSDRDSERTVWIDAAPSEPEPVRFLEDGRRIAFAGGGELRFRPWATLAHRTRLGLLRSDLRQPFGTFEGELPGGLTLARGFGVTERHEAWW
jgi:hypothetical protein